MDDAALTGVRSLVRAAGGVVCRRGPGGRIEVAVVHRPDRDDWSLPKGKLKAGETAEAAALREVWEETGFQARVVRPLGCTSYVDRLGRDKVIFYWVMWAEDGRFTQTAEVDELRWLPIEEAMEQLSYKADKALLSSQPLP